MRSIRPVVVVYFCFVLVLSTSAQQSLTVLAPRDAQATALLQQSVAAMAVAPPSDSTASGTVTIVEGSASQSGTIQIQTRSTIQTSETLNLPNGQRTIVYSNGTAKETTGGVIAFEIDPRR